MKTNIATTADQSARLLKCGVPAESADMSIRTIIEPMIRDIAEWSTPKITLLPYEEARDIYRGDYVEPAFSLSVLLGLLPKEIGIAVGAYPGSYKYSCFTLIDPDIEPIVADTAIEAAVQMIEQLTANGYKLDGIEKGGER